MASAPLRASALLKNALAVLRRLRRVQLRAGARSEPGRVRSAARATTASATRAAATASSSPTRCRSTTDRNGVAHARAEGPAEVDAAGADRCRGHVQRPERRDPDRGDADRALAERARPRRQDRAAGRATAAAPSSASSRSTPQGKPIKGQRVEVRGRVSQVDHDAQAPGRRLLRLRQPHRRRRTSAACARHDRRARPAAVRGEPRRPPARSS